MVRFPNAKINLGLRVLRKRDDGFHDIASVFYPIAYCDILEILPAKQKKIHVSGNFPEGIPDENLSMRAMHLFCQTTGADPAEIWLHKLIPSGAGMGGGSSDAAFTLSMLNELSEKNLSANELMNLSAQLGSDVPFFIKNKAQYVTGRGEIMQDIHVELRGFHLFVVHPALHISTPKAYSLIKPDDTGKMPNEIISNYPIDQWQNLLINDFEKVAFGLYPEILGIKETLIQRNAIYASMTGSGSAVYGIFSEAIPELESYFKGKNYTCKWIQL